MDTQNNQQNGQAMADAFAAYEGLVTEANRRSVEISVRLQEALRENAELKETNQRLTAERDAMTKVVPEAQANAKEKKVKQAKPQA